MIFLERIPRGKVCAKRTVFGNGSGMSFLVCLQFCFKLVQSALFQIDPFRLFGTPFFMIGYILIVFCHVL